MKGLSSRIVAAALSAGLVISGMPLSAYAKDNDLNPGDDGYDLVWSDEFDGFELNTDDWNVEAHEPGWVNAELQRYVSEDDMDESIHVGAGILSIKPTVEKKESGGGGEGVDPDVFEGNSFNDSWDTTIANWGPEYSTDATVDFNDGKANVSVVDPGTESWHVQIQKSGLTLIEGHEYTFSFKAKSDVAKKIQLSVTNTSTYTPYEDDTVIVGSDETEYSITFTMGKCNEGEVAAQINLGKIDDTAEGSAAANVVLSDVSLVDLSDTSGSDFNYKDYTYTSGRINTQGKNDFKYGYFEARARVPKGMGYLPAFWLMASDETNYGQWPQCGEIDIMEVMGQDTGESYHTIHYGYNSGSGHRSNQGTYETEAEKDFYEDYHVYGLEWEPDHLTWYVDGKEVYTTNDWYTGKDDEGQLTYPAPFDQDFYIILNLAVGGSWVGYPDEAAVNDMENQSYDVDYVRVYQKDEEVYKEMEEKAERPEKEISYREADENGNFVVNGDFSNDIKDKDSDEENWELHLEADSDDTTYDIEDNAITINPSAVGGVDYSMQLKQTGIPMHKGWTYELSFDAYAEEDRSIIVDIEGPDNGWTRYFGDEKINITTKDTENPENNHYSYTFTMNDKSDPNGSLEFCLGNQGSTSPVTISNVTLKHTDGEELPDTVEKTVRPDGNYVYNGSFDQGEKRLGYWEIDEDDKASVSVTNDNGVRELSVKVEVPEGASEANPVVVSQSELAPMAAGKYSFSFDAYTTDGSSDGIKASVAGKEFVPVLGASKQSFEYSLDFASKVDRADSEVVFEFTKPGVYYLDNVAIRENSVIKNSSFDSGLAGYECGAYSPGAATFGVDSIQEGNDNALDATISTVGTADWNVQVKQRGITLEKGKKYKLSLDARASVDRTISVVMQRDGADDNDWTVYSGDNDISLTGTWQRFEKEFEMTSDTDTDALFSVSLGKFADIDENVAHHVYIDNISLEEVTSGGKVDPDDGKKDDDKKDDDKKDDNKKDDNKKDDNKKDESKSDDTKKDTKKSDDKKEDTKPSNEWINGRWYDANGVAGSSKAEWKSDAKGWWFADQKGWYPKNEWVKIDGKWYFFTADGYMDYGEYRDGCWLGDDGAWVEEYSGGRWMQDSTGWWYEDNGWYPVSQYLWIDGVKYWFNDKGYWKE